MSFLGKTVFAAVAATSIAAAGVPAEAQAGTTFTPDGSARCELSGGGPATRGEMPTSFANRYWSNMSCGQWKKAQEILEAAPKSTPERGIPSLLDKTSSLAKCYRDSFPYSESYHNINVERTFFPDGRAPEVETSIKHGFFQMSPETFYQIQRAATAACDQKLGIHLK